MSAGLLRYFSIARRVHRYGADWANKALQLTPSRYSSAFLERLLILRNTLPNLHPRSGQLSLALGRKINPMKKYIIAAVLALTISVPAFANAKPDYITRNPDGSIKTRGVYEVDDTGRVLKFTVYDGKGVLLYTEVPFYSPDGRLIRGDRLDSAGKLQSVVVFFDTFAKVLDTEGNIIDHQEIEKEKN